MIFHANHVDATPPGSRRSTDEVRLWRSDYDTSPSKRVMIAARPIDDSFSIHFPIPVLPSWNFLLLLLFIFFCFCYLFSLTSCHLSSLAPLSPFCAWFIFSHCFQLFRPQSSNPCCCDPSFTTCFSHASPSFLLTKTRMFQTAWVKKWGFSPPIFPLDFPWDRFVTNGDSHLDLKHLDLRFSERGLEGNDFKNTFGDTLTPWLVGMIGDFECLSVDRFTLWLLACFTNSICRFLAKPFPDPWKHL